MANKWSKEKRDKILSEIYYNDNIIPLKSGQRVFEKTNANPLNFHGDVNFEDFLNEYSLLNYMINRDTPDLEDLKLYIRCSLTSPKDFNFVYNQKGYFGADMAAESPLRKLSFPIGILKMYQEARGTTDPSVRANPQRKFLGFDYMKKTAYTGPGITYGHYRNHGRFGVPYELKGKDTYLGVGHWPSPALKMWNQEKYQNIDSGAGTIIDTAGNPRGGSGFLANINLYGPIAYHVKWQSASRRGWRFSESGAFWMANFYGTFANPCNMKNESTWNGGASALPDLYIKGADTSKAWSTITGLSMTQKFYPLIQGWEINYSYHHEIYKVIKTDYEAWKVKKPLTWRPRGENSPNTPEASTVALLFWWWVDFFNKFMGGIFGQGMVKKMFDNSPAAYSYSLMYIQDYPWPCFYPGPWRDEDTWTSDYFIASTWGSEAYTSATEGNKVTKGFAGAPGKRYSPGDSPSEFSYNGVVPYTLTSYYKFWNDSMAYREAVKQYYKDLGKPWTKLTTFAKNVSTKVKAINQKKRVMYDLSLGAYDMGSTEKFDKPWSDLITQKQVVPAYQMNIMYGDPTNLLLSHNFKGNGKLVKSMSYRVDTLKTTTGKKITFGEKQTVGVGEAHATTMWGTGPFIWGNNTYFKMEWTVVGANGFANGLPKYKGGTSDDGLSKAQAQEFFKTGWVSKLTGKQEETQSKTVHGQLAQMIISERGGTSQQAIDKMKVLKIKTGDTESKEIDLQSHSTFIQLQEFLADQYDIFQPAIAHWLKNKGKADPYIKNLTEAVPIQDIAAHTGFNVDHIESHSDNWREFIPQAHSGYIEFYKALMGSQAFLAEVDKVQIQFQSQTESAAAWKASYDQGQSKITNVGIWTGWPATQYGGDIAGGKNYNPAVKQRVTDVAAVNPFVAYGEKMWGEQQPDQSEFYNALNATGWWNGGNGTKGLPYGLDAALWNIHLATAAWKQGGPPAIKHPTEKQIVNDFVASLAFGIAAFLGQYGTQYYLNKMIAKILFRGAEKNLTKADDEEAVSAATNTSGKGASTKLKQITLHEDEVKARQDFFEQCALLLRMDQFVPRHIKWIIQEMTTKNAEDENYETPHYTFPYSGRFWMMKDGDKDQNSLINKFFIPSDMNAFMNIHPSVVGMLVPKLRLYKVFDKKNKAYQIEFEFDQRGLGEENWVPSALGAGSPVDRINNLYKSTFDRGNGAGIKSFNFSFEGTSPATARNDITAELVLFFQNFNDFFRKRKNSVGEEYSFVDLVLYPQTEKKQGWGTASRNQYDPSYYRIRIDCGWQDPTGQIATEINLISGAGTAGAITTQIRQTNKSFYLNMVDHDISLKDDGTVEVKISYRAYIESLFKSNRVDALESLEIRKKREEREKTLNEAREKKCKAKELAAIKSEFLKQEQALAQLSQQSIMQRLFARNRVYWCELEAGAKRSFEKHGFFVSKPFFYTGHNLVKQAISEKRTTLNNAQLTSSMDDEGLINFQFIEENIGLNQRVHYFFMGDLIYTILDSIYGPPDDIATDKPRDSTLKNTKLILGSFDYYDFDGNPHVANIANIPISCHYFFEWYTQNVVKPKRTGYPIMYFIRDLCNQLINSLFGDLCRQSPLERKIRFNTGNFIAPGYKRAGPEHRDQFEKMCGRWVTAQNSVVNNIVIDAQEHYDNNNLPLYNESSHNEKINNLFNYIVIYGIQSPVINHSGRGDPSQDKKRGIQHFYIGQRQGIVKKINFAKTDIQYIRESRFLSQGDQGLLQLGAVYKATIDTIGNTIWYPGMEVYINPLGIGGTEFGAPNSKNSISNALGFGGYHIVTRVKNQISAGKFNTSIEAQFHFSGAPQDEGQRVGDKITQQEHQKIEEEDPDTTGDCGHIIDDLVIATQEIKDNAGIENIETD